MTVSAIIIACRDLRAPVSRHAAWTPRALVHRRRQTIRMGQDVDYWVLGIQPADARLMRMEVSGE